MMAVGSLANWITGAWADFVAAIDALRVLGVSQVGHAVTTKSVAAAGGVAVLFIAIIVIALALVRMRVRSSALSVADKRTMAASLVLTLMAVVSCSVFALPEAIKAGKQTAYRFALTALDDRVRQPGLNEARKYSASVLGRWPWRAMKAELSDVNERLVAIADNRDAILGDVYALIQEGQSPQADVACHYAEALRESSSELPSGACRRMAKPANDDAATSRQGGLARAALMPTDRWRVEMVTCLSGLPPALEFVTLIDGGAQKIDGPSVDLGFFLPQKHPPTELKRQECLVRAKTAVPPSTMEWQETEEPANADRKSQLTALASVLRESSQPAISGEGNQSSANVELPKANANDASDALPTSRDHVTNQNRPEQSNVAAEQTARTDSSGASSTGLYCHVMSLRAHATEAFWQTRFSEIGISDAQHKTRIAEVKISGKRWYRVGLGPYDHLADAEAVCAKIPRRMSSDPVVTTHLQFFSSH